VDANLDIMTFEFEPLALPEAAIPLPRLQSLRVTEDDPDSLMTLLSCLKVPSLKILSLDGSLHSSTGISILVICVAVLLSTPHIEIIPHTSNNRLLDSVPEGHSFTRAPQTQTS
jgi:hypothetical protein